VALPSPTSPLTSTADVSPLDLNVYSAATHSNRTTETVVRQNPNYKQAEASAATDIGGVIRIQTLLKGETKRSTGVATAPSQDQRFRGVVDQIDSPSSQVTLFYGHRENRFLFPTELLNSAGVGYAGALFEIVMKLDGGFHSYDIIHLKDEEDRVRREMPAADLSFLDDLGSVLSPNKK
jgi:hypothetical protein